MQSEMPTSGDLKFGDSLFFSNSTHPNFNRPPPPTPQPSIAPNGNGLGHYLKSYMK